MLKSTFLHIPGIGDRTERYLWGNRILSWEDFIGHNGSLDISPGKRSLIMNYSKISLSEYEKGNHSFFSHNLPFNLHWRAYRHFRTCFLDIETTGLSKDAHEVTTIGLYDGESSRVFVRGKDLHEFPDAVKSYGLLVTFNGRCFDLPFLETQLHMRFDQLHIDLRFLMKELGYSGGLKRIESMLGISRDDEIEGVDGFEAVRLWYRYKRGDESALKKLIAYNKADIENLKVLMEFAYREKMASVQQVMCTARDAVHISL